LKDHPKETCRVFRNKLENEMNELKNLREIHAIKAWNEIANKNYFKALDLKGFEFKKNEKLKMKNQYFINELNERNKILANGGEIKSVTLSF
jgi:histone deacetylase complex regulatory component SIN3